MTTSALAPGRRVIVSELGETPLDALEKHISLVPMDPPDPSALSPRDVIVAVKSASVGWVDLIMASGQYQHVPKPPYTPGLEWAGNVVWKGAEVGDAFAIGDEVMNDPFRAGPRSLGAYQGWGGFASYAVAPFEALLRIPKGLGPDEACNLLGSYETAYHCLVTRGRLQAGETVLVLGATGATGLAAVHVAKLVGATVIATSRSASKGELVKAQGADHVVIAPDNAFKDDVKKLTGGKGVDVVYDGVGGAVSLEALRCVRFGARFLIVGWASTPFVAKGKGERGAPNANQLPTNLIMMKGLDVLGCPTVISTVNDPSLRPPRLAAILRWAGEGRLVPVVSARFGIERFAEALRAKWAGDVVGGCVLNP
ncbi:MAG: NADPH:quinone oxidoreductase family protein [Deltaproteobacteria bacterium]|nr:NADPH:quinone oxidoreductase family protein [Deltaproteobacteria bacterium]